MGISFKISKTGTRFHPKPLLPPEVKVVDDLSETSKDSSRKLQCDLIEGAEDAAGVSAPSWSSEGLLPSAENEVSFTLNLFEDGYSIGKPTENEAAHQATLQDVQKLLHPYGRVSETLFSAIESGRLPGDILDDIPCKFVDGALVCEVRDYRKCAFYQGSGDPKNNGYPVVSKVCLKMSLENVVKDIPLISNNSWTYGNLMEVESRILKALQPQLHLDPTPKLDRLCNNPVPTKLDLSLSSVRKKRLRQPPEVTVTSSIKTHGKTVCIDRVPESSNSRLGDTGIISGNVMPQQVHENLTAQHVGPTNMLALRPKSFVSDASVSALPVASHQPRYQMGVGTPRSMQDPGSGLAINASGASPAGQDMMISYAENVNSSVSVLGKRESQDGQMSPLSSFNKRARPSPVALDGMQQQQIGPHGDGLHRSDVNWKNTLLQQQAMARGSPYANTGIQKFSQQVFEGALNQDAGTMPFTAGQQGTRYVTKEEHFEIDKIDGSDIHCSKNDMQVMETETGHLDPQQARRQRLPHNSFMRSNFPQTSWNNLGQRMEKDPRKDDQLHKRKSVQSPRISTGALAQSQLSSKSGEFSSSSVGPHFGQVATAAALVASQKETAISTSVPSVGGATSLASSANDSMQHQHQAQIAAKRRSNSLPKTPAMSGIGSPASVGNISVPLNANSPSVGSPPLADQTMLERFSKIEMVTMRHQLNCKKNKVDNIRKPNTYPLQPLSTYLSTASNNEDLKDDASTRSSLSKSLAGGSMNICKIRVLKFMQPERIPQENAVSYRVRTRMIMSEKPYDGTVAMHYGEIEDGDFLSAEDRLPSLPNTHFADLLASQLCSLMIREGYVVEDQVQAKQTRTSLPTASQSNTAGSPRHLVPDIQQFPEAVPGQQSSEVAKITNSGKTSLNSPQNLLSNARMLPPGNTQALQMSQGLFSGVSMPPRSPLIDPQPSLHQQQQQQHNNNNNNTP
ncbi:hypothetical protein I3760_02G133100 [Carya illinoinensis]|nr:hypothetical protein I3760_02G133100 [Carya illinoinensis]